MINSPIKNIIIKKLHHNAYRCIDSEATRKFYEDFLKLPLVKSLEIDVTKTGRKSKILHTFYSMRDNSFLAFFEVPGSPFVFKKQHDFDLHIALEVEKKDLIESYKWFSIAGKNGNDEAIMQRDNSIALQMNAEEIREAQKRIKSFVNKNHD